MSEEFDPPEDDGQRPYGFEPECLMDADGHCGAAGSEYCEFECPNREN